MRVIRWIEANCVHPDGPLIGRPLLLEVWQKLLILGLFALDPTTGKRLIRWAYISIPKKQGKTTLIAAIGLYLLIADEEPSPKIACAAASDEQADLLFGSAVMMVTLGPLSAVAQVYEREILVPSRPGAKMFRVAAAAGTNDGKNLSAVLIDELHEWVGKGEQVWDILTNGIGAREQPMIIQITTAGSNKETICGRQYEMAKRILAGTLIDPHYFAYIVEAPEGCDYRDLKVIKAANPNFGVSVQAEFYLDMLGKKTENVYRRYFLNQWTESEEAWLPPGAWGACSVNRVLTIDDLDPDLPLHVAIDAARTHDSTAVMLNQQRGEKLRQVVKNWMNPYPLDDPRHDQWRIDLATIENYLLELFELFPAPAAQMPDSDEMAPGPAYYYDPWRFDRSAEILRGKGLNMIEVPQTDSRMGPACMTYYDLIVGGTIEHGDDPDFALQIGSAVKKDISDRAWRLTKPRGARNKHIDDAIAGSIGAYHAWAIAPVVPSTVSIYETEHLFTF
jgi:phage terminase large subunit-like protein